METNQRTFSSRGRPFSPTREAVLRAVEASSSQCTIQSLAGELGLHENTVRMHLTALLRDGFVRQSSPTAQAETPGPGRPAVRWEAQPRQSAAYVELVRVLAGQLRAESENPSASARAAGAAWGRSLAEQHTTRASTKSRAPRDTLVEILRDEGFAPDCQGDTITFRQCPLIEAAGSDSDIVCGVHLGLVTGALERLGAHDTGSTLVPFAAPGECTLHLRTVE